MINIFARIGHKTLEITSEQTQSTGSSSQIKNNEKPTTGIFNKIAHSFKSLINKQSKKEVSVQKNPFQIAQDKMREAIGAPSIGLELIEKERGPDAFGPLMRELRGLSPKVRKDVLNALPGKISGFNDPQAYAYECIRKMENDDFSALIGSFINSGFKGSQRYELLECLFGSESGLFPKSGLNEEQKSLLKGAIDEKLVEGTDVPELQAFKEALDFDGNFGGLAEKINEMDLGFRLHYLRNLLGAEGRFPISKLEEAKKEALVNGINEKSCPELRIIKNFVEGNDEVFTSVLKEYKGRTPEELDEKGIRNIKEEFGYISRVYNNMDLLTDERVDIAQMSMRIDLLARSYLEEAGKKNGGKPNVKEGILKELQYYFKDYYERMEARNKIDAFLKKNSKTSDQYKAVDLIAQTLRKKTVEDILRTKNADELKELSKIMDDVEKTQVSPLIGGVKLPEGYVPSYKVARKKSAVVAKRVQVRSNSTPSATPPELPRVPARSASAEPKKESSTEPVNPVPTRRRSWSGPARRPGYFRGSRGSVNK